MTVYNRRGSLRFNLKYTTDLIHDEENEGEVIFCAGDCWGSELMIHNVPNRDWFAIAIGMTGEKGKGIVLEDEALQEMIEIISDYLTAKKRKDKDE